MEPEDLLRFSGMKRKSIGDDTLASDFLKYVSISPRQKRMRQDIGSTSGSLESQTVPPHVQMEGADLSINTEDIKPVSIPNEQRALVLYKPVTPPLFPGGPIAGSSVQLNTAGLLSSEMLRSSGLLAIGTGEFVYRGNTVNIDDDVLAAERDHTNSMAVIPWVPNGSGINFISLNPDQAVTSQFTQVVGVGVDTSGAEAMEEDSEIAVGALNGKSSNCTENFAVEPWQHYGMPQPHYGPVMWSH